MGCPLNCEGCPGERVPRSQRESLRTGVPVEILRALTEYGLEFTVCGFTWVKGKVESAEQCNTKIRERLQNALVGRINAEELEEGLPPL